MKTAKADSVKCSARMMPTRSGGRMARSGGDAFCDPKECGIEQPLNGLALPLKVSSTKCWRDARISSDLAKIAYWTKAYANDEEWLWADARSGGVERSFRSACQTPCASGEMSPSAVDWRPALLAGRMAEDRAVRFAEMGRRAKAAGDGDARDRHGGLLQQLAAAAQAQSDVVLRRGQTQAALEEPLQLAL